MYKYLWNNGMRAAIFNSMPIEGIEKLRHHMREFAEENQHIGMIEF